MIIRFLRSLYRHVGEYSEAYLIVPLGVLAVIGAPFLYLMLTGRPPVESGELDLVTWAVRFLGVTLILCLAGLAKSRLLGYHFQREPTFRARVLDGIELLLILAAVALLMRMD